MKQLAERYPWIDLAHAGIWGTLPAAATPPRPPCSTSLISSPSASPNPATTTTATTKDDWAEKWAGLLSRTPTAPATTTHKPNQAYAKNLKGHLLLAHGTMDDNVPTSNTLLVVDCAHQGQQGFRSHPVPQRGPRYGPAAQYMTRRRWDYFVRYLAGATPPHEYQMEVTGRHPPPQWRTRSGRKTWTGRP